MNALIDTCVIIDALQNRLPHSDDAHSLFLAVANKHVIGFLSASSVTDIYYLTRKYTHNENQAREILQSLFELFNILETTQIDCLNALHSSSPDFEDAVMIETARRSGMDCLVTRNTRDYEHALVPVYSPKEFLELLQSGKLN